LPARYPTNAESEIGQLETLAGVVDVSWLGLMLHQTQPDDCRASITIPDRWPDGFFRHTIPEGQWMTLGTNQMQNEKHQTLAACLLQLMGPEWLQILDNLWIEPLEREALINLSQATNGQQVALKSLASHLVGIPVVYLPNHVIPMHQAHREACGQPVIVHRVPGCGLLVSHDHAEVLWETLMSAGLSLGLNPIGVDARQSYYESFSG
ncbi:MAG: hypothetical protein VKK59_06600, partial [Vampirovibrionales bacterium]|nr:hypothetical protein [Vampirovibrionales bacterium]